jgi:hypothetical protein
MKLTNNIVTMRKVGVLKKDIMDEEFFFSRRRGRGIYRGGVVRCYTCGKKGHKSWECPERKNKGGGEEHVFEP